MPPRYKFLLSAALFFFAVAVHAENPFAGLTFPVPELGNCADVNACKVYCDDPGNQAACLAYGEAHGLISGSTNAAATSSSTGNASPTPGGTDNGQPSVDISTVLQNGGGPGGCTSQNSCHTYCEDISHLNECMAFGKAHGLLSGNELSQAEKISAALQNGATPPGGCTSKESCQAYCQVAAHIDECVKFGEQAGIIGADESAQAKKFAALLTAGQTPGGCSDKTSCQTYCADPSHQAECQTFAQKMGFTGQPPQGSTPGSFQNNDQNGGPAGQQGPLTGPANGPVNGPGGCDSADSCATYCNDPANQNTCITFARDHGFIKDDQAQGAIQSLANIASGLDNQPDTVKQCIQGALGDGGLQVIQSGTAPTLDQITSVKQCFDNNRGAMQTDMQNRINGTPGVKDCIVGAIGQSALDQMENGTGLSDPSAAEKVRQCFTGAAPMNGNNNSGQSQQTAPAGPGGPNQNGSPFPPPPAGYSPSNQDQNGPQGNFPPRGSGDQNYGPQSGGGNNSYQNMPPNSPMPPRGENQPWQQGQGGQNYQPGDQPPYPPNNSFSPTPPQNGSPQGPGESYPTPPYNGQNAPAPNSPYNQPPAGNTQSFPSSGPEQNPPPSSPPPAPTSFAPSFFSNIFSHMAANVLSAFSHFFGR